MSRRWQELLTKTAAGAAGGSVGAAMLPVGGPVAAGAAGAAVDKATEALLNEFLRAQDDQLARIEAINEDLRYRLVRLERGMNDLLDEPWRSALSHIQEATYSSIHYKMHIEHALQLLIRAHTLARSDIRCSWIAQDLAVVYAISGDTSSAIRWFGNSYKSGLNGLKDQVWEAAKTIESETEKHARVYERHSRARNAAVRAELPSALCHIDFNDKYSQYSQEPSPFKRAGLYSGFAEAAPVRRLVQGLGRLFYDLAQLRRVCIIAGIDQRDLYLPFIHDVGIRVASFVAGADFDTLEYFDTRLPYGAERFYADKKIDAGIQLQPPRFIYIRYS